MNPIVSIRGLRFTFEDGTEALRGIDFDLEAGHSIALLGPNGSGKTTFALHLNGILKGSGTVVIDGLPVEERNLTEIRRRVGLVFQDSDNQLFMPTILEDVAFGLLTSGVRREEAEARAREVLSQTGMLHQASRAPWQLSAGEKKRAAIAGILAMSPKLLVLDEPTTFLDPPGQRELIQLLVGLPQAKVVITHDAAFARHLTREAAFFFEGQIVARGDIDSIATQFGWQADPAFTPA
jgi:cobalt/nickel transport system ATP-binding protein